MIVAGKGGVGKTTVTATLARVAADVGLRVLVLAVDGGPGLDRLLGCNGHLSDDETVVTSADGGGWGPDGTGVIHARLISAGRALNDYLDDHGLRRITGRLIRNGVLDIVATSAPGIDDILILGRVKQLERAGQFDVIILDAPAAGHAISFLQSARGLADAVGSGPIATQAREVLELLGDPARSQVILVTLPEETPVNELVDTAFAIEDRVGVSLGPVVVNGLYPDDRPLDISAAPRGAAGRTLIEAAEFRITRASLQREQVERLSQHLPLPQISLPFLFDAAIDPDAVGVLAAAFALSVERLP